MMQTKTKNKERVWKFEEIFTQLEGLGYSKLLLNTLSFFVSVTTYIIQYNACTTMAYFNSAENPKISN
jgi:ABC-type maltose transport system permease subunit